MISSSGVIWQLHTRTSLGTIPRHQDLGAGRHLYMPSWALASVLDRNHPAKSMGSRCRAPVRAASMFMCTCHRAHDCSQERVRRVRTHKSECPLGWTKLYKCRSEIGAELVATTSVRQSVAQRLHTLLPKGPVHPRVRRVQLPFRPSHPLSRHPARISPRKMSRSSNRTVTLLAAGAACSPLHPDK